MIIGIPKETKKNEFRVALVPEHAAQLTKLGHTVFVEKGAGAGCKFSDVDYEKAGAQIKDSVYDSEMIVRVKEPLLNTIRKNQIVMGYLHIEKGQNPPLLNKLLNQNTTSYAYEEIKDNKGERLVNLGVEAGIVGMYEGLRLYGKILERNNISNKLKYLKPSKDYFSVEKIFTTLSKSNIENGVNVYIFGKGTVSKGAQEILKYSSIKANVLYRNKTAFIEKYLPKADIIVNAIDWYPGEPHIIKRDMLKLMKKTAVIVDISCDTNGGIETCIPTTWENPTYSVEGVTHFCVDNLPSAIPRDASIHLSEMILPHVIKVAEDNDYSNGLMTKKGIFEYAKRKEASEKFEKELLVIKEIV
jgi:alanine dehydrogenase|tara:strand:- start:5903 stop:6976 length:1074 start_codon:yes stop_codon:yes gene_type:complete